MSGNTTKTRAQLNAELEQTQEELRQTRERLEEAEEAVRVSEGHYRTLTDACPDGIAAVGADGLVSYASPKVVELFGCQDASEVLGSSPLEWVAMEDRERARTNIDTILQGGHTGRNQYRLLRKDGAWFWGDIHASAIGDPKGNRAGLVAIIRDATEQKKAQDALRESEQLYRSAVDATEAAIVRLDLKGRRTYANRWFGQCSQRSDEELLKGRVGDIQEGEDRQKTVRAFRECKATGQTVRGVVTKANVGGKVRWARSDFTPLRDSSGVVVGVQSTSVDVTELVGAREAALRAEQFYRGVVETGKIVDVRLDLDGNRTYVSTYGHQLLGFDDDRRDLGRFADSMEPESRELAWSAFNRVLAEGTQIDGLLLWHNTAKGRRCALQTFTPIKDSDGRLIEIQSTGIDITAQVEAQEKLRHSEELYRSLVDTLQAGVVRVTRDRKRTFVNRWAADFAGRSVEELMSGRFEDTISDPARRREAEQILEQAFGTGEPVRGWVVGEISGGRMRYRTSNWEPVRDATGTVVEVQVTSFDITELVEARERLRRSEDLYRSVVELTDAAVVRFDAEGRRTFVNESFVRRHGKPAEELLGGVIGDQMVPEDAKKDLEMFRLCISSGQPVSGFISRHIKGARVLYARGNLTPVRDAAGKVVGAQVTSVDITDLMEVQESLRRSEQMLRAAAGVAKVAVVISDLQGRRMFVNNVFCERFGVSEREALEGSIGDTLVAEDAEKARTLFHQCVSEGTAITGTVTRCLKDGRTRYLLGNLSPVFGADGQIANALATSIDITEIVETQESLQRSEQFYRGVAEGSGLVVARLDTSGKRTYVNTHGRTLLNLGDSSQSLGTFADSMEPESREQAWEAFRRVVSEGVSVGGLTCWHLTSEGRKCFVQSLWPVKDSQGRLVSVLSSNIDITAQMEAQEQLRRSEELYRSLVESVGSTVIRVDREGRRTFVSQSTASTLQSAEELRAGRFGDSMVPEDRERAWALLRETFASGQPVRDFVTRQVIRGQTLHISASWVPIKDAQGNVVEVQTNSVDVTEQAQLQERYNQAQKMESVGRLAGGVAHDFNNLLTAILGYSELALAEVKDNARAADYIKEVISAGESSATLVSQLLAFSRRQPMEPKIVDLNAVVREIEKILRRVIGEDIDLKVATAPEALLVKVDSGQVGQVLMNLAVNARDAMPGGGRLTVTLGAATLDESTLSVAEPLVGEYAVISVKDTGSGMTDEVKGHLFEPFFTTKGPGRGTGLGLATCYGIVKQSGGDIRVTSETGAGSTFTIYLPLLPRQTPASQERQASTALPKGTETVLLVEDEAAVRRLALRALQQQGYTVLTASNGVEALRLVEADPNLKVDLLLTDVVMPQMGGLELAQRLGALRPGLKVLYMSGYTEDAAVLRGMRAAGMGFVQKPASIPQLAQTVRQALDQPAAGSKGEPQSDADK